MKMFWRWSLRPRSGSTAMAQVMFYQVGGVLGSADDPDHRRQRKVLQDGFRPAMVDALTPRCRSNWSTTVGRRV